MKVRRKSENSNLFCINHSSYGLKPQILQNTQDRSVDLETPPASVMHSLLARLLISKLSSGNNVSSSSLDMHPSPSESAVSKSSNSNPNMGESVGDEDDVDDTDQEKLFKIQQLPGM